MSQSISAVAHRFGMRTSAVRYYERIGLLPHVPRIAGRRIYDRALVQRLAIIQRARSTGFSIDEIRELFDGFPKGAPPAERWQRLSGRKISELQQRIDRLAQAQEALRRMGRCRCESLSVCGERFMSRKQETS